MLAAVVALTTLLAAPTTISSPVCSLTVDGLRITEVRNALTGESFRPTGDSFSLFDAAYKAIPLANPQVGTADGKTTIDASSPNGDHLKVIFSVDGPDICVRLEANTSKPGLRSAAFGFKGASEPCTFIAPILCGLELAPSTPVGHTERMYPGDWESQLALLQNKKGGVWIRSTDTEFGFKWVFFDRNSPAWSAEFRNENQAPYTERSSLKSPEWRISAYRGDWRTPTELYRQWMERAFGLTPINPASWESRIRCVITTQHEGMTDQGLDRLAQLVHPEQTLLYIPSWRTHGYDEMYPDYDPAAGVVERVRAAKARGFRVMLHTDFPGVTGTHPFYEQVKQHRLLEATTKEPMGWWLEKKVPQSFYYIDPASPIFRGEFVRRMLGIQKTVGPDAIHLDVSAPTWNNGAGLIEGMNYPQGARKMHDDLAAALPDLVWGGEHITESTLRHERFWQVWPSAIMGNAHTHPIVTALYWPYCRGYGYLGMPDPTLGETEYERYLEQYDLNAYLVTIPLQNLDAELAAPAPALTALFNLARAHQELLTEPDIDAMARNGGQSVWRGRGQTIRVDARDGLSVTSVGKKPVLAHGHGLRAVKGFYPCSDWPAWNEHGTFGLDPGYRYLLTPTPPQANAFHIAKLSGNATQLRQFADYPDAVVLNLAEYAPTPAVRLADAYSTAKSSSRAGATVRPIEDGAVCQFEDHTSGSVPRHSLFILPPWHKPDPDWITGMKFQLHVPPNADLHFWMGMDDNAQKTDGTTFIVYRDNEEIFRRHYTEKKWEEVTVPLGNGANRNVSLELATHPGPKNDRSWDLALFGEPVILAHETHSAKVTFVDYEPKNLSVAFTQGARLVRPGRLETPNTAPIILFKKEVPACALPARLLDKPVTPYLQQAGDTRPGAVFGSGALHSVKSSGVEHLALNAHPPAGGKTVFPWVETLPKQAANLKFTAGIGDGALTDGVTFSIRVNGKEAWHWFSATPGWHDATLDLGPFAGKAVLIEFVTDSGATNNCDWANWFDVRIE